MAKLYGKVDCLAQSLTGVGTTDAARVSSDNYINMFKFLEYLQTQGEVDLVTYYAGSGSVGTGKDYWDSASNSLGLNAFSVWRMKANGERNWDWYLYIHASYGASSFQQTANSIPTTVPYNGSMSTTPVSSFSSKFLIQAAFSISGSSSTNPWNGTISLSGTAQKGTPVWNTGAAEYTVHVFPRFNNLSGASVTNKEACAAIMNLDAAGPNQNFRTRSHYFYDGHGLLFVSDISANHNALPRVYGNYSYLGPFRLSDGIVEENQGYLLGGTSSLGFIHLSSNKAGSNNGASEYGSSGYFLPEGVAIGVIGASSIDPLGGVFASTKIGVRNVMLSIDSSVLSTTYMPNDYMTPQTAIYRSYDEKALSVYVSEAPYYGFLGIVDSPLVRVSVGDIYTHDMTADKKRIALSARSDNNTARRAIMPWNGSTPPGNNMTRDGINFADLNYQW